MPPVSTQDAALEAATMRRVFSRMLPFLVLAYLICYIDRVNVGFAGLQMNQDIGLSKTIFGLGGGIFFIGYFLLEVPSNLAMERFGASRWIARIMISWGIISGAMAFTAGIGSLPDVALSARRGGGGVLSGCDPLSDLLVPRGASRAHRWHLHGGDPGRRVRWLAAVGRDPGPRRLARRARLAVGVHSGGDPGGADGRCLAGLADRPAGAREMAVA